MVIVRTLARADLPAALDLFAAVAAEGRWLATEPPVDRREVVAGWEALLDTGEGTVLAAHLEEGAPPCGLLVLAGRERPRLGMLVAAEARRRGVGRALLEAAVGWARAAGAAEVSLLVFTHNEAAAALYARHGFLDRGVLLRAFPRRSGERWDARRMVLHLG